MHYRFVNISRASSEQIQFQYYILGCINVDTVVYSSILFKENSSILRYYLH